MGDEDEPVFAIQTIETMFKANTAMLAGQYAAQFTLSRDNSWQPVVGSGYHVVVDKTQAALINDLTPDA